MELSRLYMPRAMPLDGALKTSQLHAQGTNPAKVKAGASELDLDGKTPDKYQNPE